MAHILGLLREYVVNYRMNIKTKRVYEQPVDSDGIRILVDRLWPRGVSKESAQLDDWMKEIAPSDELRDWFDHDPEKWEEFVERYRAELQEKQHLVDELREYADEDSLTLIYAAKDETHNNAVALKTILTHGSRD